MPQLWDITRERFEKRLAQANADYEKLLARGRKQRQRPTLAQLAAKHGISASALYKYRMRLRRRLVVGEVVGEEVESDDASRGTGAGVLTC